MAASLNLKESGLVLANGATLFKRCTCLNTVSSHESNSVALSGMQLCIKAERRSG